MLCNKLVLHFIYVNLHSSLFYSCGEVSLSFSEKNVHHDGKYSFLPLTQFYRSPLVKLPTEKYVIGHSKIYIKRDMFQKSLW